MSKLASSAFSALVFSAITAFAFDLTSSDNVSSFFFCRMPRGIDAASLSSHSSLLGQNSYGATGGSPSGWQQTISNYCQDTCIDVIPIAFVDSFTGPYGLNLANESPFAHTTCGVPPGNCAFLAAGIEACQAAGKIVTLSLGGAGGSVGFASNTAAIAFANAIWNAFLGGSASYRPFGAAILDGVDLDIESGTNTGYAAFANEIRTLWASAPKRYYLSAAPQCPYPDAWVGNALSTVPFDFVNGWNFATWNTWAQSAPNPNVKIFIGAPASTTAANPGEYVFASTLGSIALSTLASFGPDNFGGVMLWDASQAYGKSLVHSNPHCC
ncbi:glycoside hydrolase superfamily [Mycena galopus ATCC 62051]|nr:glycoside hydrolase superfamily [Mycena galopus ATCC 62051]